MLSLSQRQSVIRLYQWHACRTFAKQGDEDGATTPKRAGFQQKKKSRKDKDPSQREKNFNLIVKCLDAPYRKEPPISEEEKARRHQVGRNYVIGCFQRNNRIQHDLTCKVRMKQHAVEMLPRNSFIREQALKESDRYPPEDRNMPKWTPPIPGFNPDKYIEQLDPEIVEVIEVGDGKIWGNDEPAD